MIRYTNIYSRIEFTTIPLLSNPICSDLIINETRNLLGEGDTVLSH